MEGNERRAKGTVHRGSRLFMTPGDGPMPVCLDGGRERVRRFSCLHFRHPQIRFVSGTVAEITKVENGEWGLVNSEGKSCPLGGARYN